MVGVSKATPQGKQIIKNIYLSFFYGAKIGIIGLNGSGKSTVMKIIAGLIDEAIVMKDNESALKDVASKVHHLMSERPLFV